MKASKTVCTALDSRPRTGRCQSWGILSDATMDTPLGSPLRRKEDQRLVTGRGRYVEDLRFPGMLHAAFVRSPHAHARVRSIDTAAARALGGVIAVYTARDLPECARPIPPSIAAPAGFKPTAQPVFADPLVRYVGEVVAAVVAEDFYVAADAAAAVVVDYEPLPAAGTMERALEPRGRRVKWPESRREHFLTAAPDGGQRQVARLGLTREGRITAVETRFTREHGAYVASGEVVTRNTINHLPGPYRIPSLDISASNVVTNAVFGAAYRGSGRPEANFVLERLIDRGARALGMDPAELRRRNMIRAEEMPYRTGLVYRDGTPVSYDPADYVGSFDRLLSDFGSEEWRRRQDATAGGARPIGVGLAAYVPGTGGGPFESADVRIDSAGTVHRSIAGS